MSDTITAEAETRPAKPGTDNAVSSGGATHSPAVTEWIGRFALAVANPESADWSEVFADECYWRDFVAVSWNIVTAEGLDDIVAMAKQQLPLVKMAKIELDDPSLPGTDETHGWFTFETDAARGRGGVALVDGKAQVVLTTMLELKGFEEPGGDRRPMGIGHKAAKGRKFWPDHREEEERTLGHTVQPYCLIVGAGQNGLQLAARFKRLGVPTLIVDALPKVGDCWRFRYKSLYLHDAIFMDHFPYMPFPDHWPLYTPTGKMGDWLETYATTMELNVWNNTTCTGASYDEDTREWTVTVERDGEQIALNPKQFVLATGLSGAKNMPNIKGMETFKGQLSHSSDYRAGGPIAGKKCVVIGANNSAHDIATDMWEADADVTMIQRSPTIVWRAETMRAGSYKLPYADPKIDSEFADAMLAMTTFKMHNEIDKATTRQMQEIDADFYKRLEKAGFLVGQGEDDTGLLMAYARRAGGYYIDVGASELVASGEIKIKQGEIAEITEDGVMMEDGTFLPADIIVCATGYRPMQEFVGNLISKEVEDKIGPCWGLGSDTEGDPGPWQGELKNMWKPTAQEGLWFQGGNLMQSRFHSLHLALQIKARMEGLPTPVYQPDFA